MKYANLSVMHRASCRRLGSRTALRYKQHGLFHDISWSTYRRRADMAAAGLIQLGVGPGDRVALFSENRHEWFVADHAMLSAGAITVPLHAPLTAEQAQYQISHSEARGVIVSNQAQADKVLSMLDSLPELEFIVSFDSIDTPKSLPSMAWEGLKHRGMLTGREGVAEIWRREAERSADDLATIIYTSGTTGNPKGVMLTHGNLLSNAEGMLAVSEVFPSDTLLSWLPYSHIYARTVDHYVTTVAGLTVALAESIDSLIVDLKMTTPNWMTAVPRFYEKVWMSVEQLAPAERKAQLHAIFGPRVRYLSSGGAPLPDHVCEGFIEAGIPLLEGYGLTETSPVVSFNSVDDIRVGTVGRTIPDVDVKIADDGEILTRGPNIMQGYWKNPEATAEVMADGWFATGDVGELDADGYLKITDRKKDLIVTSGGKNIAPSEIERLLVSDEYIDQAVVYGDGRQFISALVVPNFPNLEEELGELGIALEQDGPFLSDEKLHAFFDERISTVSQSVSQPERVKKFLLLSAPFKMEDDELTATLKVRRRNIVDKYELQLAALYD